MGIFLLGPFSLCRECCSVGKLVRHLMPGPWVACESEGGTALFPFVTSLTELPLQGNGLTSDISSTPRPAYQFGTAEASGKRSYLPLGAAALPQLSRNR